MKNYSYYANLITIFMGHNSRASNWSAIHLNREPQKEDLIKPSSNAFCTHPLHNNLKKKSSRFMSFVIKYFMQKSIKNVHGELLNWMMFLCLGRRRKKHLKQIHKANAVAKITDKLLEFLYARCFFFSSEGKISLSRQTTTMEA